MSNEQEHYLCSTTCLGDLYERLRAYTLNLLAPSVSVYGLGVILFRGMAAWISVVRCYTGEQHGGTSNNGLKPIGLPQDERSQLQEILAEVLVQHCHKEVSW